MDSFISVSDIYNGKDAILRFSKKQKKFLSKRWLILSFPLFTGRKCWMASISLKMIPFIFTTMKQINCKIPVSKLKAVAYLSPYIVEGDEVDAESYMVGFQVDTQKGNDIFDKYMNVIAYFGSKIHL
jgi:hypothetical protein